MPPPDDRRSRPDDFDDEGPRRRPRRSDERIREEDEDDRPRRRSDSRYRDDDDDDRPRRRRGAETVTSTMAVLSFVLGLASVVFCALTGLPAVILGVLGLVGISRSGGQMVGKGFAWTGIVIGVMSTALTAAAVPFVYWKVEEEQQAQKESNNLKQVAIAMHNYHDTTNEFPPAVTATRDGQPGLSWRVLILPYLEQDNLYRKFKLDEPWDSPHNKALLSQMPDVYRAPGDPKGTTDTPYRVFVGQDAPFSKVPQWVGQEPPPPFDPRLGPSRRLRVTSITDGTSNTFCVAESSQKVPWTKPDEMEFSMTGPMPELGSAKRDYFQVVMFDGSIRRVHKAKTSQQTLRLLINPNDGQAIPFDW